METFIYYYDGMIGKVKDATKSFIFPAYVQNMASDPVTDIYIYIRIVFFLNLQMAI